MGVIYSYVRDHSYAANLLIDKHFGSNKNDKTVIHIRLKILIINLPCDVTDIVTPFASRLILLSIL